MDWRITDAGGQEITSVVGSEISQSQVRTYYGWPNHPDVQFAMPHNLDNGKEFAGHKIITEEPGVPVYFAHPHCPWERGTNENTNKQLRKFLPKGKSLDKVTQKELDRYVSLLNNRLGKCLGYKTPREAFEESFTCVAFGLTN